MLIQSSALKTSGTTFHGIVPGKAVYPLGKISLEVAFGNATNFRKETLDFEVVDWKSQYHAILGRPVMQSGQLSSLVTPSGRLMQIVENFPQ